MKISVIVPLCTMILIYLPGLACQSKFRFDILWGDMKYPLFLPNFDPITR
jgi:hypothetical protein